MVFSGSSGFPHQYLKIDRHDIAEILLKVALNTITLKHFVKYNYKRIKLDTIIFGTILHEVISGGNHGIGIGRIKYTT
jgi:hypothetical protein